jgi:2-hydroxychromene-2-carboxylate isomerase
MTWGQGKYNKQAHFDARTGGKRRTLMASTQRRYGKEEFARRGDAVYESAVRPHLKPSDEGKFVAIDIETGMYEMAAAELEACDRLRARLPDPQIWLVRVGSRYVHRFGALVRRSKP